MGFQRIFVHERFAGYVFREIYQMIDESPMKVQDRDKPGACHQGSAKGIACDETDSIAVCHRGTCPRS
jgi:hypothetical protein